MDPQTVSSLGPYDYDLLVIGGGSGGLAVAKEAAALRKKVLILDLEAPSLRGTKRELGGSSLNLNSIRKFLQQASLLGKAIQDSQKYGWRFKEEGDLDMCHSWSELVEAVQEQVKSRSLELKRELESCGVFYLNAGGEIVAPHTVQVTDMNGRKRRLTAETLVIATGDRPQYLGVPGDRQYCLTSEDLLSLPHSPGRTLVVGGSAEGLECAGFLSGLGLPVTVMLQPDLLPGFDQKMAQKIENHMLVAGVEFLYHCSLAKVEQAETCSKDILSGVSAVTPQQLSREMRLRVTIVCREGQTKQEDFDTVLLSVGRKACTSNIGLECVGVQCSQDSGRILVNERDQTSVDHIYAIGSVQHGRPTTTGLSVHAGTLLAHRLYAGDNILCDYTNVPTVVLTPVEYAACGLSEEKANLTFGEATIEVYHSYYWPLEWTLPARNKNSCYVKVICHIPDHERVVGLHVMGPNAGDILQGFVAAMKCGLTKRQLDATVGLQPGSAQVFTSLTQTQRMSEALMLRGNC
ncbi:thioredoxin reductase 1, cytoplasmic-like isoform X1 [Thunnus maccoyii]|uniref:thioredoxin reductase 1, cytoplasmic-like isoform X1 n=1 Tax=Thunnus maccoyii TaxID=8240 RepID=UPI001C4CA491|nr:thioredoxin reductase 1, cytoplasmic-like isoform X1 [Thunnus maccoyii]XP_042258846.1 thioredoxin reductase 1, cytoplasmic-like isoform X1 [Thunnus maccoyii]XP_042258847.1 thioredoxin reductase 1, cytoplasmic-like isoform X1 [Thunnus maccoyii]XP_042258848.1 thioredoxin reductase 1, cytoplasmic-like isoform X1 [Thunnus maccoyii]